MQHQEFQKIGSHSNMKNSVANTKSHLSNIMSRIAIEATKMIRWN